MNEEGHIISEELADALFLLKTGWTWEAYHTTPNVLVEKMIIVMNAEAEVARERAREMEHAR